MITTIKSVEVIEQPKDSLVGLKWQETREIYGKEATETMWITKAKENQYYEVCANSHGTAYTSRLSLASDDDGTELTISFLGEPQTLISKLFAILLGWMFKGGMVKMLEQDLADIKAFAERKAQKQQKRP